MMIDGRFGAFLAVATLLIITPGPDMALVTRNALIGGRRAASLTGLGVAAGTVGWAVASVAGVGVLLQTSATAFMLLKLAGAAYLCYLGLRSLVRSITGSDPSTPHVKTRRRSHVEGWAAFRQGLLGNLVNPKAAVIFVTIFPQFIRPGDSPIRLLVMLLAFEVTLVAWLTIYGSAINRAGRSRVGSSVRHYLERVTGVVLIGLGVRLALEGRTS